MQRICQTFSSYIKTYIKTIFIESIVSKSNAKYATKFTLNYCDDLKITQFHDFYCVTIQPSEHSSSESSSRKVSNDRNFFQKLLMGHFCRQVDSSEQEHNLDTEAKRCFATHDGDIDHFNMRIYIILIACVYIQQFNFVQ